MFILLVSDLVIIRGWTLVTDCFVSDYNQCKMHDYRVRGHNGKTGAWMLHLWGWYISVFVYLLHVLLSQLMCWFASISWKLYLEQPCYVTFILKVLLFSSFFFSLFLIQVVCWIYKHQLKTTFGAIMLCNIILKVSYFFIVFLFFKGMS
jgi:hypothetical protein